MSSPELPPPEPNPYEPPQVRGEASRRRIGDERSHQRRHDVVWMVSILLLTPAAAIAGVFTCIGVAEYNGGYDFITGGVTGLGVSVTVLFISVRILWRWANRS